MDASGKVWRTGLGVLGNLAGLWLAGLAAVSLLRVVTPPRERVPAFLIGWFPGLVLAIVGTLVWVTAAVGRSRVRLLVWFGGLVAIGVLGTVLLIAVGGSSKDVRINLVRRLPTSVQLPLLERLLVDPHPGTRIDAAFALEAQGPAARRAVPALEARLEDLGETVREGSRGATTVVVQKAAASAIARIDPAYAARHPSPHVQRAFAFFCFHPQALDPPSRACLEAGRAVPAALDQWTSLGPEGATVVALAIDPTTPTTLYAGTRSGVFKSADGGGSWRTINTGLSPPKIDCPAQLIECSAPIVLAIDPATPTTLYTGSTAYRGFFKSVDGGGSWSAVSRTMFTCGGAPPELCVAGGVLAVDPAPTTTLYVGTNGGGVVKSVDGGGRWSEVNTGLTNPAVLALAIDPATPTTLYAGTGAGVFKTVNRGASWRAVGLDKAPFPPVHLLAVDPRRPMTVYAATSAAAHSPLYKSVDGGESWVVILDFMMGSSGLARETISALAIDPATPTTLYVGTPRQGILKSADGGTSWSPFNQGLTALGVRTLAIDPTTPTTVYAGTVWGGVFRIRQRPPEAASPPG